MDQPLIVYLHGFRSSPASHKARQLRERMQGLGVADRFFCPQLPPSPKQAMAGIEERIRGERGPLTFVGSSLGGYYATWLAEKHDGQAVLVNPAVIAYLSLKEFVGTTTNLHTGEAFEFRPEYIDELRALEVAEISQPERFWLLLETGDELLDYRQAVLKYACARQTVIEGGDHTFQHWPEFLDDVVRFAGLPA